MRLDKCYLDTITVLVTMLLNYKNLLLSNIFFLFFASNKVPLADAGGVKHLMLSFAFLIKKAL